MPWGRMLLAALASLLVIGGIAGILFMAQRPINLASAPGVSAEDAAALVAPFDAAASGRDGDFISLMVQGVEPEQAQAQLDQIQALLPSGRPTSSRLVNYRTSMGTNGLHLVGVHEHMYPDHAVRAETVLYRANAQQPWQVLNFHVNVATNAELAANRRSLAEQPPNVIAFIVGTVVNPPFMLATFWAALFMKGVKPRWLWALVSVIALGTFQMNGATGAIFFAPLSIQLFGASATWSGSVYDPWVFGLSLPLGALAFWLTRVFKRDQATP